MSKLKEENKAQKEDLVNTLKENNSLKEENSKYKENEEKYKNENNTLLEENKKIKDKQNKFSLFKFLKNLFILSSSIFSFSFLSNSI